MSINGIVGLSLAINGGLLALVNTSIYHVNVVGLVLGGLIMLAGAYLVVKGEFE